MRVSARQAFLNTSNLAEFLGVFPIEAIHMPVPINFVFVGFNGDGNMGVNYSSSELQTWFGLLDHVLPHNRIELAELSCAEDGEGPPGLRRRDLYDAPDPGGGPSPRNHPLTPRSDGFGAEAASPRRLQIPEPPLHPPDSEHPRPARTHACMHAPTRLLRGHGARALPGAAGPQRGAPQLQLQRDPCQAEGRRGDLREGDTRVRPASRPRGGDRGAPGGESRGRGDGVWTCVGMEKGCQSS